MSRSKRKHRATMAASSAGRRVAAQVKPAAAQMKPLAQRTAAATKRGVRRARRSAASIWSMSFDDRVAAAREERRTAEAAQAAAEQADLARVAELRERACAQLDDIRAATAALDSLPQAASVPDLTAHYYWFAHPPQAINPSRWHWGKASRQEWTGWDIIHIPRYPGGITGPDVSYDSRTHTFSFDVWSGDAGALAEKGELRWPDVTETHSRRGRKAGSLSVVRYFHELIQIIAEIVAAN